MKINGIEVMSKGLVKKVEPIDKLKITDRIKAVLLGVGIGTIQELTSKTKKEVRAIDGIGDAYLLRIITALEQKGLTLKETK